MKPNHGSQERRQHPRLAGNIPLKICCGEFDVVTETQNISRSGAYCRVNKFIEPMTRLKICLLLPFRRDHRTVTKKINCEGIVVRTESLPHSDAFHVAIFFNDIQTRDGDTIAEFVDNMLSRQPLPPPRKSG